MTFLFLSIVCSVLIANLLKLYSRDEKAPILIIFSGNYLFASIISQLLNRDPLSISRPFDIAAGAMMGMLLLVSFLVYEKNIQKNGLSLSVSVMRSSLLIPIVFAILVLGERVSAFNYAGIGIILFTFFLMSGNQPPGNLIWILLLFGVAGVTDSFFKIYDVYGSNSEALFLFFSFSAAFIFNIILILRAKCRFQLRYFLYGIVLGIPNQLTAFFFMKSLKTIPAAVAYPMFSSSIVLMSIATDIIIWRSKFTRKQAGIFILMIFGVILLNLGR